MVRLLKSLSGGPVMRTFVQHSIAFSSRSEAARDVMSGKCVGLIVLDTCVKFHDPSLNRSRENWPETVGSGIFDIVFAITSDRDYLLTSYPV